MNPWESVKFRYPPVPTMITPEERRYLFWLGAQYWKCAGHIVEIGPWLGGSTVCLATGMRTSARNGGYKLHVFDNFRWRSFMADRAPLPLTVGSSFQHYFEKNVEKYMDLIVVHKQSLPDGPTILDNRARGVQPTEDEKNEVFTWDSKQPIEILFIDGAKSLYGLCYLLKSLARSLVPNETLIVCQDYKYWGTYWVPLVTEYLSEHFELKHVLQNNTVAFVVKSAIGSHELEKLESLDSIEISVGEALLDGASQRLHQQGDHLGALIVRASKIRFFVQKEDTARAESLFRELEAQWPVKFAGRTVDMLREWMEQETGKRYTPTKHWLVTNLLRRIRKEASRLAARVRMPDSRPQ